MTVDDNLSLRDISAPFEFPAGDGRIYGGHEQLSIRYKPGLDGQLIVEPYGYLSAHSAPCLRNFLLDAMKHGFNALIMSLEEVSFTDYGGLGVLVGARKRARANGGYVDIVCTQESLLKAFRITGLTKFYDIFDTVNDAIASRGGQLLSD